MEGFYSTDDYLDLVTINCQECEAQMICNGPNDTLTTIEILSGYWRSSAFSTDIRECSASRGHGCKGGAYYGEDSCHENYKGPLCGVCKESVAYFDNIVENCRQCKGDFVFSQSFYITISFLVIGVVAFFLREKKSKT